MAGHPNQSLALGRLGTQLYQPLFYDVTIAGILITHYYEHRVRQLPPTKFSHQILFKILFTIKYQIPYLQQVGAVPGGSNPASISFADGSRERKRWFSLRVGPLE